MNQGITIYEQNKATSSVQNTRSVQTVASRNQTFVYLYALAILMVIDDHCCSVVKIGSTIFPYNSFYMPMFVFCSGYFFKQTSILENIKHKTKKLLIPYIVWNLLMLLVASMLGAVTPIMWVNNFDFVFALQRFFFYGNATALNYATWFVLMLFWVSVIYHFIKVLFSKLKNTFANDILLTILYIGGGFASVYVCINGSISTQLFPLWLCRTVFYLQFYHLGYMFKTYWENYFNRLRGAFVCVFCVLVNVLLLVVFGEKLNFYSTQDMGGFSYWYLPLITSITGTLFYYTIMKRLSDKFGEIPAISLIGSNTMLFLQMHLLFINIPNFAMWYGAVKYYDYADGFPLLDFFTNPWVRYNVATSLLGFVFAVLGCYWCAKKYEHIKQKVMNMSQKSQIHLMNRKGNAGGVLNDGGDEKDEGKAKEGRRERYTNLYKICYALFLSVITIKQFLLQTMLPYEKLVEILDYIIFFLGIFVLIKVIYDFGKSDEKEKLFISLVLGGMVIAILHHPLNGLVEYILLILGAKGMDGKQILKFYLKITIGMTILTITLALLHIIPDLVTYRSSELGRARHGLGFSYATNMTSHLLIIVMLWAYIRNKKSTWLEIVAMIGIAIFAYLVAEARIAAAVILGTAIWVGLFKFEKVEKRIACCLDFSVIKNIVMHFALLLSGAAIMLGVCYRKGTSVWERLNDWSSQRLRMNALAFERYDVGFLGQSISQVGQMEAGQASVSSNYFVLNTSYISILFELGILGLITFLIVWWWIQKKEYQNKNYIGLGILLLFAVYCFFEHRMDEFTNNPWLLLVLAAPKPGTESAEISGRTKGWKSYFAMLLKRWGNAVGTAVFLSLLTEILIFNFASVRSVLNSEVSYANCRQDTTNVEGTLYETLESKEDTAVLYAFDIPTYLGIESIYLDINRFTNEENYKVITEPYQVSIYDISGGAREYLNTFEIDPKDKATWYLPISVGGFFQNLEFEFAFRDCHFVINEFWFNSAKGFELSMMRILIMIIVFTVGVKIRERNIPITRW